MLKKGKKKKKIVKKPVKINRRLPKVYKWGGVVENGRILFCLVDVKNSFKEAEIMRHLDSLNIDYYREVSFDMVKRFDFYIPTLDIFIEYDGKQHDKLEQQINDGLKNQILINQHVRLIRYNRFSGNLFECLKRDLIKNQPK